MGKSTFFRLGHVQELPLFVDRCRGGFFPWQHNHQATGEFSCDGSRYDAARASNSGMIYSNLWPFIWWSMGINTWVYHGYTMGIPWVYHGFSDSCKIFSVRYLRWAGMVPRSCSLGFLAQVDFRKHCFWLQACRRDLAWASWWCVTPSLITPWEWHSHASICVVESGELMHPQDFFLLLISSI